MLKSSNSRNSSGTLKRKQRRGRVNATDIKHRCFMSLVDGTSSSFPVTRRLRPSNFFTQQLPQWLSLLELNLQVLSTMPAYQVGEEKPEIDPQYYSVSKWFSEVKVDAIIPINKVSIKLRLRVNLGAVVSLKYIKTRLINSLVKQEVE